MYLLQIFMSYADSDGSTIPANGAAKPSGKHRSKRGARGAWGADHEVWKVLEDDSLLLIKGSRVGGEREPTEKGGGFKLKFVNSLHVFFYVHPPKKIGGNDPIWGAYFFQMGWIEPPTSKDRIDFDCYGNILFHKLVGEAWWE